MTDKTDDENESGIDENLVCFTKVHKESKSDKAVSVEDRVLNCMSNPDCNCKYCGYKKHAASMVIDFLARDIMQFEKNSNSKMCTYDLKDVFFKAIKEVKEMEKDGKEEQEE